MANTIWEYKAIPALHFGGTPQSEPDELMRQLNKQGEEHWELVMFLSGDPNKSLNDLWIFKRPMEMRKPKA